ncbi:hypothetical protein ONS96_011363 [Cadophora gregata f. sp. sojae]|nr:hypothetical protein ONS96_011363 [Cadophora gregata f. sp. sojae]
MAPPPTAPTGKKSRNGCKTCKIRRVKCDETKPFCNRCKDLHITCDGYVVKKSKGREGRGTFFPILPKSHSISFAPVKLVPEVQPARILYDQQHRYFDIFRQTTAATLAEYLDTTLWNRIVLQETEANLSIKHSVIALGALHKALDGDPYPHAADTKLSQSVHYRFALQQYGKALRLTRTSISSPESQVDSRALLISCFLSICFECIHGSTSTAVAHIQSGISMLDDFCSKQPHCISFDERQALPGFLEDEMLSVLCRLESDVTGLYDAGQLSPQPEVEAAVVGIFYYMPTDGFQSLTSARKYLDLRLREVGWFITSCNEQRWSFLVQDSGPTVPGIETATCLIPTIEQQERAAMFQDLLQKWLATFQATVHRTRLSQNSDAKLSVTALSLRAICASISLSCCFGPETAFDPHIPEFERALQLAEDLHLGGPSSRSVRPTFITSSILIRSLYFVALKCRCSVLRRRALSFLEGMPRREGIWDAVFVCNVARAVVAVEEGGEDWSGEAGLPPEEMRVTSLKTSFDLYKRKGHVRYLQSVGCEDGVRFMVGEQDIIW